MDNMDVFQRIKALSHEARLYADGSSRGGSLTDDARRLEAINVELDQCYDLIQEQLARRVAGLEPAGASLGHAEFAGHDE